MMKLTLLLFGLLSSLWSTDITTKDIRKPSSVVFDITKNTDYALSMPEIYSDKIPAEISPIWGYRLRANKIDNCKTDSHSATYCPLEMAQCGTEWNFADGASTKTDKTISTPTGCAGTIVNGVCYEKVGDATRVTNLSCRNISVPCAPGASSCCHIDFTCNNNAVTVKYYDCCSPTGGLKYSATFNDVSALLNGVKYQNCGSAPIVCNASGACSVYFQNYWCSGCGLVGDPFLSQSFSLDTSTTYNCPDNQYVGASAFSSADPTSCYNKEAIDCGKGVANPTTKNCDLSYSFYKYGCSTIPNQFGEIAKPKVVGGVDCNGVGLTDINNDAKLECNNPVPPTNNCEQKSYTCLANAARPCADIGGEFKCSPFACDDNKKCGYAHCPTEFGATSGTDISPLAADPLKYRVQATTCKSNRCDLVEGPRYTMCGKKSCPAGFGVYEKDGKCYKDTCKSPSVEIDGKCVTRN